jgi:hypothetical protein
MRNSVNLNRFAMRFDPVRRIKRRITRAPFRLNVNKPAKLNLNGPGASGRVSKNSSFSATGSSGTPFTPGAQRGGGVGSRVSATSGGGTAGSNSSGGRSSGSPGSGSSGSSSPFGSNGTF